MVKGHLPKPGQQISPKEIYAKSTAGATVKERGSVAADEFTIDMSDFWKPPRAMSALQMMDVTAKYSPFGFSEKDHHEEDLPSYNNKEDEKESANSKSYDWVSYVDELYASNMQKSA